MESTEAGLRTRPSDETEQPWKEPTDKGRTIDEIYDLLGFGWFQIQLLLIVGISMACDAMEITMLSFIQECVALEWDLSSTMESALTGAVFAGQVLGMMFLGPFGDIYGRRAAILFGWFFVVVFGLASCLSPNIYYLIVFRALVGIGIGASQTLAYDLFAETVPTLFRSRIIYMSLFSVLGELYVDSAAWILLTEYGWRWLAFTCAIPMVIVAVVGYFMLPESPRWLTSQERYSEAEEILSVAAVMNEKTEALGNVVLRRNEMTVFDQTFSDLMSGPLWLETITLWVIW
jgi:putative MFS transporter